MKTIFADVEYLMGHLRYGHYELKVSDEEYKEFQTYSNEEKRKYIEENGDLVIDDYELDDSGTITSIRVYND